MTPEEFAQNFVRQFDKLNNDDKSKCLNEIARIFSVKYDLYLGVEMETTDEDVDFYDRLDSYQLIPLTTIKLTFTWDVDLMEILNEQYPV